MSYQLLCIWKADIRSLSEGHHVPTTVLDPADVTEDHQVLSKISFTECEACEGSGRCEKRVDGITVSGTCLTCRNALYMEVIT